MDNMLIISMSISFVLSFIFSLGGIGAAVALIPTLTSWVGLPMQMVKPIALLSNVFSLTGASIENVRQKRLNWKNGFPLILSSSIMSPIGAFLSQFINVKILSFLFVFFLIFSSAMILFYNKKERGEKINFEPFYLFFVGILSGTISGLLGIGGGAIISPLLIARGYKIKAVTVVTAFVIPFSSFTAFLGYIAIGQNNWMYILGCSATAFIGGMVGTVFMQKKLNSKVIKKILAFVLLIMAIKMILKII